jgi:hypothetical protein
MARSFRVLLGAALLSLVMSACSSPTVPRPNPDGEPDDEPDPGTGITLVVESGVRHFA